MMQETAPRLTLDLQRFANDAEAETYDREFFIANPLRSHLVRAPFTGELAWFEEYRDRHPDASPFVAVRQLRPGLRVRATSWGPGVPPNAEELAHIAFDTIIADATGDPEAKTRVATRVAQLLPAAGAAALAWSVAA